MSKSRWKRGFIIRERNWQSDAVPNYLIRSRVFRNFIRRRRKRCVSRDSITERSIIVSIEGKDGIGTLRRGIPWWISGAVLIFWVVRLVTIPERHHVPTFHTISSVISVLARFRSDMLEQKRNTFVHRHFEHPKFTSRTIYKFSFSLYLYACIFL